MGGITRKPACRGQRRDSPSREGQEGDRCMERRQRWRAGRLT
jgi:hypothetical protein